PENLLPTTDLTGPGEGASLDEAIAPLCAAQLDLAGGEVFRAGVFKLAPERHAFFFMPHHVVWDGSCFPILLTELGALYTEESGGEPAALPALSGGYLDFLVAQEEWLLGLQAERQHTFWQNRLGADSPSLDLPSDRPRPRLFTHEGDWLSFGIAPTSLDKLRALAAQTRGSTFMVLMAVWQAFLARHTGQSDVRIGAHAQSDRSGTGGAIGYFANTLCLAAPLAPEASLETHAAFVRDRWLEALDHRDVPFDAVVDRVVAERDPSRTPLFQAAISHHDHRDMPDTLGPLRVTERDISPPATLTDVMLTVFEAAAHAHATLSWSTDLFDRATMERFAGRFERFLASALEDPTQPLAAAALMTDAEHRFVVETVNGTARPFDETVRPVDLILKTAERLPGKIAIRCDGEALTYRALAERSAQIAQGLAARGVGRGDVVGLHLNRSIDLVPTVLGVWLAGAAYLPLDPSYPTDRLRYVVADCGVRLVASSEADHPFTPAEVPTVSLADVTGDLDPAWGGEQRSESGDLAYVLYTSGSTGKPKGVENAHRQLGNFLHAMASRPGLTEGDRLLAITTLSFDISMLELFLPLVVGAELVLATAEEAGDGFALADLLDAHDITVLQATPAGWKLLLEADWPGDDRLTALCGGEALPSGLAEALLERVGSLWNMYGPTETTIWSTSAQIRDASDVTIGTPIDNTQIYVLDGAKAPAPIGVEGDVWIGGAGVARGYRGRTDLTAERFIPDPFSEGSTGRLYKTGDRGRLLTDGRFVLLGRTDSQVKLRGHRIELGEIEAALASHKGVKDAAAAVHTDGQGEAMLVAYPVFEPQHSATGSELRAWLRQWVPGYMVPQFFLPLEDLPLTGNRKIDRAKLPLPGGLEAGTRERIAPRTGLEIALAEIWSEILAVPGISVLDNFFELGGQSLQVARFVALARDRLGIELDPRAVIFETLEQLAAQGDDAADQVASF
ncbi:MAG: amino acid adenylation domain-containing protein, partial [Pseudomonadota bacterium]